MKGISERDETTSAVSVSNSDNIHQFEEQREKFKKEARRLRKMKNRHIVKVHDLFEENGTAYYVMDYIDGESLSERQKCKGVMSEYEARKILLQILDALDEVHDNEIWHLDLKPGNIMLGIDGNVYLIDFGASKQLHADGNFTTSTACAILLVMLQANRSVRCLIGLDHGQTFMLLVQHCIIFFLIGVLLCQQILMMI